MQTCHCPIPRNGIQGPFVSTPERSPRTEGPTKKKRKGRSVSGREAHRGMRMMRKPISMALLAMAAGLSGIFSCATAPNKPLVPGELRLSSIVIPEKEKIKVNSPFTVNISFETDGKPEIRTACFTVSGDGPHCLKATDVDYGPPGTISIQIHTKNPGSRLLEAYVLYLRDGKVQPTNVVSTYLPLLSR